MQGEVSTAFGCVGSTIRLRSGIYFDLADPQPESITPEDIAGALSKICRFGGQINAFYSVAEHCCRCAFQAGIDGLPLELCRSVFLHDAAEAYVVDVPRPLKRFLPGYKEIEREVARAIEKRFGLPVDIFEHGAVKHFDEVLLATEARDIMGGQSAGKWTLRAPPLTERAEPLDSAAAEAAFLSRFHALNERLRLINTPHTSPHVPR